MRRNISLDISPLSWSCGVGLGLCSCLGGTAESLLFVGAVGSGGGVAGLCSDGRF